MFRFSLTTFVLILLMIYIFPFLCSARHLNVISILPFNPSAVVSLNYVGAALEIAVEKANVKYADQLITNLTLLYARKDASCEEEEAVVIDRLAPYYYRELPNDHCAIIIGGRK